NRLFVFQKNQGFLGYRPTSGLHSCELWSNRLTDARDALLSPTLALAARLWLKPGGQDEGDTAPNAHTEIEGHPGNLRPPHFPFKRDARAGPCILQSLAERQVLASAGLVGQPAGQVHWYVYRAHECDIRGAEHHRRGHERPIGCSTSGPKRETTDNQ